jgi:hypothetical protein
MSAWSQSPSLGAGLSHVLGGGDDVAGACYNREYSTGFGPRIGVPVLRGRGTVVATARAYWLGLGVTCVIDPFVPMEGTYIVDDGVSLLAIQFITTDVRFEAAPVRPLRIGAGVGAAWREGRNVPYGLLAAGVSLVDKPSVRLSLDGELTILRISEARRRDTYQNFIRVTSEPLGIVRHWTPAFAIGMHFEVPLR